MTHSTQDLCKKSIAVFRSLPGLGDFLCVIPALRALRAAFPTAQIVWIGLPSVAEWVTRFDHYIDEFVEFPGYPGLPEQSPKLDRLPDFLNEMQQRNFDLAIQMHGSGVITNQITIALGAQQTAGFFHPDHECPNTDFYLLFDESEPEIRRYLRLMEFLGIPADDETLEFPIGQKDRQELQSLRLEAALRNGRYGCIHAGASVSTRRWAVENFVAVGDFMADMGLQVVLTGSTSEWELAETIAHHMKNSAVNLAGQTSLGALAALLNEAQLLVCNDTGVSHLAAALQVPSVVVFSGSNPQRWAPLDRVLHRSLSQSTGVKVADVFEQINALREVANVV